MALGGLHTDSGPARRTGRALLLAEGTAGYLGKHHVSPAPDVSRSNLTFLPCRPQKAQDDYVYKKVNLPQADVEEEDEEEEEEEEETAGDKEEEVADEAKGAAAAGESCQHAAGAGHSPAFLPTWLPKSRLCAMADDAFTSGNQQGRLTRRKRRDAAWEVTL